MRIGTTYMLRLVFLLVLFFEAIQSSYAVGFGELRSEKVVVKGSEGNDLVKAWEALIDAPDWARLNTEIVELGAKESDDLIRKNFGDFYATTMKNQTPSGFDGGEKIYDRVWYNKYGFPDFKHLNQTIGKQYNFPGAKGNYSTDLSDARDWLKKQTGIEAINEYNGTGSPLNVKVGGSWKKITWHHHENGTHLIPVFTDAHSGLSHTGGVKTVELGINHLFDYL